jgi:hypothetical protein
LIKQFWNSGHRVLLEGKAEKSFYSLLYHIFHQRGCVRAAQFWDLQITTNLVFSEWERIFKNPMTTLAAIDRVTHHCVILDMMPVDSYRAHQANHQHLPQQEEVKTGTTK